MKDVFMLWHKKSHSKLYRSLIVLAIVGFMLTSVLGSLLQAADATPAGTPAETKEQRDQRMAWWRDAFTGDSTPFPPALGTGSQFRATANGS
jgi:hypothetical protein